MPYVLILELEEAVKKRICVLLYGLWLDNFLFYLLSLACGFSRGVIKRSDSILIIVRAVFFAPFAGLFLIGDSDAEIRGTGLGNNNQDWLQYFSE